MNTIILLKGGEAIGLALSFSNDVCGLDPGDCGCDRMENLEPEHGPRDPFDEAMIPFKSQGCSVLMIWAVAVIGVQRQPPWPVGGLGFA